MGSNVPVRNESTMKCHIIIDSFLTGTLEPTNDQFLMSVASHRYREVTGSNPVVVLNFSGFFTQLQKLRS